MAVSAERSQYDNVATSYNDYESLPMARLEAELIRKGLRNCTGLRVLDLGGGSDMHARKAIELGAIVVDLVDISPEMLKIGSDIEATLDRQGASGVNYHLADATKPMDDMGLRKQSYDLIIANWLFDHATSVEDLEGMWRNISEYAKPGGRFLGTRIANMEAESLVCGKYGCVFRDVKPIRGGVVYRVLCLTEPVFEFEATTMDVSRSGSTELHEKFGFENVEVVNAEGTSVVKQDPGFWRLYLDDPFFVVVSATKSS